jgi:leucine-rich repeat protein SHOC2
MTPERLAEIIDRAKRDRVSRLDLDQCQLVTLPSSIGSLTDLTYLSLENNRLICLPESIGNLTRLTKLKLQNNQLTYLPESIGNLTSLATLYLRGNQLESLPESFGNLKQLKNLMLDGQQLQSLPESIGNLCQLTYLQLHNNCLDRIPDSIGNLRKLSIVDFSDNRLTELPENIGLLTALTTMYLDGNLLTGLPDSVDNLSSLRVIDLRDNPEIDLSRLNRIPNLNRAFYGDDGLVERYWDKRDKWKSKWLLSESNAEIKRILIQHLGYERIYNDLGAIEVSSWREYTLLKIADLVEPIYDNSETIEIGTEPMILLKMTCPSTGHIHILRVPPNMTSAEAAITWVNHGIHPDEFAMQT